jgi:hypothetical protein
MRWKPKENSERRKWQFPLLPVSSETIPIRGSGYASRRIGRSTVSRRASVRIADAQAGRPITEEAK